MKSLTSKIIESTPAKPAMSRICQAALTILLTYPASVLGDTFNAGAYIIDMGAEPQTYENGIKPYGLIYDLVINNKIPVYWAINPAKSKDGRDFSYNSKDYKGGSFIIPQNFAADASTVIASWQSKGVIVDGPTSAAFDAPIFDVITSFPNAVLDDANGKIIQKAFYEEAEIPETSYRIGTPNDVQPCDDIFALPHADPEKWDSPTVNNFKNYINGGGFLWSGCRAPSGLENSTEGLGLHYLSQNGLINHDDHDGSSENFGYDANTAAHPIMQMLGSLGLSGGSEEVYVPENSGWRATTTIAVEDKSQKDVLDGISPGPAAMVAFGHAEGNGSKGFIVYESSHDISSGGTDEQKVAAARIYGNFLLLAGIGKKVEITVSSFPSEIIPGASNAFSITAPKALSFNWTSSCGGTFSPNNNSDTVDFNAPATANGSTCIIRVTVQDACGRTNFITNVSTTTPANTFTCDVESQIFTSNNLSSPTSALSTDTAKGTIQTLSTNFHATNINGIGYNLKDNYIWGYDRANDRVVRVDKTYDVVTYNEPTISGLPEYQYHLGDVSADGVLYLSSRHITPDRIYRIDIDPQSTNYLSYLGFITLSNSSLVSSDFAIHPANGYIYLVDSKDNHLYQINTATGQVTDVGDTGLTDNKNSNVSWFDSDGYFYFNKGNTTDNIFRVDLRNTAHLKPEAVYVTKVSIPQEGDGARCLNAGITAKDYDYGDAPDSYSTDLYAGNASGGNDLAGARHLITHSGLYLGNVAPDRDGDGQASINADGDDSFGTDDEDAFTTLPALSSNAPSYTIPASSIKITNTTGKTATLYGFIDFNQDGDFNDPGEGASVAVVNSATQPGGDLVWNNLPTLTTGTTYARFRISTDASLTAIGTASDGEVEDYTLDISDAPVCHALIGDLNAGLGSALRLSTNDEIFLASTTVTSGQLEGHLKAYTVTSSGAPATSPGWDAASTMTKSAREARLKATDSNGAIVLLDNLDAASFNHTGSVSLATIVDYTIDPGHDGGAYLNGRRNGSFLGPISSGNSMALISKEFDVLTYLENSYYRSYRTVDLANRKDRVVFSSDDGFLYAVDQENGALAWGWMPHSLVSKLHNPATLLAGKNMHGTLDVLDLEYSSGNFATYLVGSYKSGLGQFVLKLDNSGNLSSVVWDADETTSNNIALSSPENGKRAYFSDASGATYAAYVITNNDGTSYLRIRNLINSTSAANRDIALDYKVTSVPYIITDFKSANAPAAKTIYLGDENGNIYSAPLLVNGGMNSETNIGAALKGSAVTSLHTSATSPVLFIGASRAEDDQYYLRAQSKDRLTVFKYVANAWKRVWTTYDNGAGKWGSNGAYTSSNTIKALDVGTLITAEASIVSNSIVLPVTTAATGANCDGDAYYYLYQLADGEFPADRFYTVVSSNTSSNSDNSGTSHNSSFSGPISIGKGKAVTLKLGDFANGKLLGFGVSTQKTDGTSGVNKTIYIIDQITTGIRSWRELRE